MNHYKNFKRSATAITLMWSAATCMVSAQPAAPAGQMPNQGGASSSGPQAGGQVGGPAQGQMGGPGSAMGGPPQGQMGGMSGPGGPMGGMGGPGEGSSSSTLGRVVAMLKARRGFARCLLEHPLRTQALSVQVEYIKYIHILYIYVFI